MPDLGPHASFIWASYGIVAAAILALAMWLIFDGKRQAGLLRSLERDMADNAND